MSVVCLIVLNGLKMVASTQQTWALISAPVGCTSSKETSSRESNLRNRQTSRNPKPDLRHWNIRVKPGERSSGCPLREPTLPSGPRGWPQTPPAPASSNRRPRRKPVRSPSSAPQQVTTHRPLTRRLDPTHRCRSRSVSETLSQKGAILGRRDLRPGSVACFGCRSRPAALSAWFTRRR